MSTQNGIVAKSTNGTARSKTSKTTVSKSNAKNKTADLETLQKELETVRQEAAEKDKQVQEATTQLTKLETELNSRKLINVADALVKVAETKAVADRLEFLRRTRKELSAFALGSDGNRDVLSLRDGSGNSFESHNSETINMVLDMLKKELDKKIESTETELLKIA